MLQRATLCEGASHGRNGLAEPEKVGIHFVHDRKLSHKMNFGQAIQAMKSGEYVQRDGWNGTGMYLFSGAVETFVKDVTGGGKASDYPKVYGTIFMVAADGGLVAGWLASQTDMLAEDWRIAVPNLQGVPGAMSDAVARATAFTPPTTDRRR